MAKKTNLDTTEDTLGQGAAVMQESNRTAIMVLGFSISITGLLVLLMVIMAVGGAAAAHGYADIMYLANLMAASAKMGLEKTDVAVISEAHNMALWKGYFLMVAVSGFIIVCDLLSDDMQKSGFLGACIEFVLGVAAFVYRAIESDATGAPFWAMIVVGSLFIAPNPFMAHRLACFIRKKYGYVIDAWVDTLTELVFEDFKALR